MTDTRRLVPKRRFREFIDDGAWEQRELETIYGKIRNAFVGTATPYYVPHGHFYLESNNIKDGQINRNNEVFINDEFYLLQKDNWLRTGDMVMVQSGHVGHAAVIPPELNNSAAHALIIFSNPKEMVNPYFLNYQYQTTGYKKTIDSITTGNTIEHILSSEMKKFTVLLTEIEEQNRISEFFIELDNLITLQQRKLEKIQNLKSAYLSKMFPKEGEKYPELRFAGFTEAWEQRKLGDMGDTFTGLSGKTKEDFGKGEAEFITYLNVFNNPISNIKLTERVELDKKQNEVRYGDIFFTTSSETPGEVGMSSVWLDNRENVYLNSFCFGYRLKDKVDPFYMAYSLRSNPIRNQFILLAQGISRYNISKTKAMDIEIMLPKLDEQIKLGKFFKQLDNLITLHQRKLDKLKSIKQAYLNEMFV
jgi:type I restriction enzyme S subunit